MYLAVTRPLKVARFLGYADMHSPLCRPEHRAVAAAALLRCLHGGRDGCSVVLAEKLPGGEGWGDLLGGTLVTSHPDPRLNVKGMEWAEFLASRSGSFRGGVRRKEAVLQRDYDVRYRRTQNLEELDTDFETLARLHDERWDDATTGFFAGDRGLMNRELAREAMSQGWLRLWVLELDGEPAAAYYGWRYAGSEWCIQAGRDLRFAKHGVGAALFAHVVRDAFDDKVSVVRFLAGAEPYKVRWADEDVPAETRLLASSEALARAALALLRARSVRWQTRQRMDDLVGATRRLRLGRSGDRT
jgi:CelD/BcsL family acetyltransferase involved in cellulose biosynthesis